MGFRETRTICNIEQVLIIQTSRYVLKYVLMSDVQEELQQEKENLLFARKFYG